MKLPDRVSGEEPSQNSVASDDEVLFAKEITRTSQKRQRADTAGTTHAESYNNVHEQQINHQDIETAVKSFDNATIRQLLMKGAAISTELANLILQQHRDQIMREAQTDIDFDRLSKSVWKEINISHRSKTGSQQYDVSFDVAFSVIDTIEGIAKRVHPHSNFATKRSGLETLRKIGKTICLSNKDVIGHEVQLHFQRQSPLEESMIHIVKCMTDDECKKLCTIGGADFLDKVEELEGLAQDYYLMKDLYRVLELLRGKPVDKTSTVEEFAKKPKST